MTRVLVLGGTSEIALAIVRRLAQRDRCEALLAGRNEDALATSAQRLKQSGCERVETAPLQALASEEHAAVLRGAFDVLGQVDVVILAVGVLGSRGGLPEDIEAAVDVLAVNVVGAGSLLMHSARALREQGRGTLVVLSSVAAERPRASNAVYCASKAALDALAQGVADALHGSGVGVMVVRPGFVRTRMTRGLEEAPFATDPDAVAEVVVRGLERGTQTVWAPPLLRLVMAILKLLPRPLFRRLAL